MYNSATASSPPERGTRNPELLDAPGHACGFFQNEDEEYEVLLPFIREGLGSGERVVHVIEPGKRDEHLSRLAAAGIEVDGPLSRGQLVVIDWIESYLPDGSFNQERTSANFSVVRNQGRNMGFPRTRVICRMDWAVKAISLKELALYESTADFMPLDGDVAICVYHTPIWGGQMMMTALRTHQYVILGGLLHKNPFHNSQAVLDSFTFKSPLSPTCC